MRSQFDERSSAVLFGALEKIRTVLEMNSLEMEDESGSTSLWRSGMILPSFDIFH